MNTKTTHADIVAACLVITALLAYLNHRFLGIPTTIGVMIASLALSLALIGLSFRRPKTTRQSRRPE
jgi:hypothetical protein